MTSTTLELFSFIWHFMKKQRLVYFFVFLTSMVWACDVTIWPYILRRFIDLFTEYEDHRNSIWQALQYPIYFSLSFWLLVEFGFRSQGFLLAKALPKLESRMRMHMFDHVQHHSPNYFNKNFAGSLSNRISEMTTQVSLVIQQILTTFIPAFIACILAIIFLYFVKPLLAWVLGGWIVIHFLICYFFTRKCDHLEHVHGEARSVLMGKIVDSFTNNFAVNLFYRFGHEKTRMALFGQVELAKNIYAKTYTEYMRVFLGIACFLFGGVAVNGFMIYFWTQGAITTGEIAQVFNTMWNITFVIWMVSWTLPQMFQSIGLMKQAYLLMKDPQDILDPEDAKPLTVTKGGIVFNNVTFNYGQNDLFTDKHVHIKGGEKVGLVGYSGSGKTTFINLILRFYEVQKGSICIDGQDISKVTLESIRRQVTLIPQDPQLFHRSIKENIAYSKLDATDQEIAQAAKDSHSDLFIRKTPFHYETEVGERGTLLSGGERQRIAIARALLANTPILILDEATSALDSITEKYIQESLGKLMESRTTLVIAHRLSTLSMMDRILVFDQGKIVEEGTHQSLLEKKGHYARMWQMQAGGFIP